MPRNRPTRPKTQPVGGEQWTVGEMARRAKCTLRTIRFYEQQGLMLVEERTFGRHRRYALRDLERLQLIVELRQAGLSLDAIRALLELKQRHRSGVAASLELRRQLETHIKEVASRVAELARIKDDLEKLHAVIQVCKDCSHDDMFPNACANCESFAAAAKETPLLRALWSNFP